jgi:type II secretion system protein I
MIFKSGKGYAGHLGFTLVEVLVALSIVVVSFVALYSGLLQMVSAMTLMQEKTIATWIAYDRITELRVVNEYPDVGESDGEVEMALTGFIRARSVRPKATTFVRSSCVSHPKVIRTITLALPAVHL